MRRFTCAPFSFVPFGRAPLATWVYDGGARAYGFVRQCGVFACFVVAIGVVCAPRLLFNRWGVGARLLCECVIWGARLTMKRWRGRRWLGVVMSGFLLRLVVLLVTGPSRELSACVARVRVSL